MGRASLSEAILLLKTLDVNYSNMRTIANQLQDQGFDKETASKAVRLAVRDGSEIQGLVKSALAISEAIKAIRDAAPSASLSDIYDAFVGSGVDPTYIDEALDTVDLDSPDITVDSPEDDEIYHGEQTEQHNNSINELDSGLMEDLERFLERNPNISPSETEKFLGVHGLDGSTSRAVTRMLFSKTASIDINPDQLAKALKAIKVSPEDAFGVLTDRAQFSPESSKEAIERYFRDEKSDEESGMGGGPGEPGMDEENPEGEAPMDTMDGMMGMGGGLDETGMAVGDPGISDMSGAMDLNDMESDSKLDGQEARPGEVNWADVADSYSDTIQDPEEMHSVLRGLGASEQEARQVANRLNPDSEVIRPGASVIYKGKNVKVAYTTTTLYGDMYAFDDGSSAFVDSDDVKLVTEKTASEEVSLTDLLKKADDFYTKSYVFKSEDMQRMASEADDLISELSAYKVEQAGEKLALREKITNLKHAKKLFEEAAAQRTQENQEYLESQPKYAFATEVVAGNGMGPGGADAIAITAQELQEDRDSTDWDSEVVTSAVILVEENPNFLSSAGDMRKAANALINSRISHLEKEQQEDIKQKFFANVEKARRIAVRELTSVEKTAKKESSVHEYDEGVYL